MEAALEHLHILEELLVQAQDLQHTQALIAKPFAKDPSLKHEQCALKPARKRPRSALSTQRVIPQGRAAAWSVSRSQHIAWLQAGTAGTDATDPLAVAKAFDAVRVRQPNVCIRPRLTPPAVRAHQQETPTTELQTHAVADCKGVLSRTAELHDVCKKCDQGCWYACPCDCHTGYSETVLVPALENILCCDDATDNALNTENNAQSSSVVEHAVYMHDSPLHSNRVIACDHNEECTQCDKSCWFGCTCECHYQIPVSATTEQRDVDDVNSHDCNNNMIKQQQQQHRTEIGDSKLQQHTRFKQQRDSIATVVTPDLNDVYRRTSEYTQNGGYSFGSSKRDVCCNDYTKSCNSGDDADAINTYTTYTNSNRAIKGGYISNIPRFSGKHTGDNSKDNDSDDIDNKDSTTSYTVLSTYIRPSTVKIHDIRRTTPRPRLNCDKVHDVPGVGSYDLTKMNCIGTRPVNVPAVAAKKTMLTAKSAQIIAAQQTIDNQRAPGTYSTDDAVNKLKKRTDIGNITMMAEPKHQIVHTNKNEAAEMKQEQARIDKEEERKMAGLPRKDYKQDYMYKLQQGLRAIEARVPVVHIVPRARAKTVEAAAANAAYYDVNNAEAVIEARTDVKGALFAAQAAALEREQKRLAQKPKVIMAQKLKQRASIVKDFLNCELPQAWVTDDNNGNITTAQRAKGVYRYREPTNVTAALKAKQAQERHEKADAAIGITYEQYTAAVDTNYTHQAPLFSGYAGRDEIHIYKKGQQRTVIFNDPILNKGIESLGPGHHTGINGYNTIAESSKAKAPIRFNLAVGRFDAIGPNGTKPTAAIQSEFEDNNGCNDGDHLELTPDYTIGKKRARHVKLAVTSTTRMEHVRHSLYDHGEGLILDVTKAVNAVKPRRDAVAVDLARARDRFNQDIKTAAEDSVDGDNLIIFEQTAADLTANVKGHKFSTLPRFQSPSDAAEDVVLSHIEPNIEVTRARAIPQYTFDMHKQRDRFSQHVEFNEHDERELRASAVAVDVMRTDAIASALDTHTRVRDSAGHINISKQLSPRDKDKQLETWQDADHDVKLNTLSTYTPVRQSVAWSKQSSITGRQTGIMKHGTQKTSDASDFDNTEGDILALNPNPYVGKKGIKQGIHWSKLSSNNEPAISVLVEPEAHEIDAAEHARINIISKRSGGRPLANSIVPMDKMPARYTTRTASTRSVLQQPVQEPASADGDNLKSDKPSSRVLGGAWSQYKRLDGKQRQLISVESKSSDDRQHVLSGTVQNVDMSKKTAEQQQYHNSLLKLKSKLVQSQQQGSWPHNVYQSSGSSTVAEAVPDLTSDLANLYM
jgi:hypothetical protein